MIKGSKNSTVRNREPEEDPDHVSESDAKWKQEGY